MARPPGRAAHGQAGHDAAMRTGCLAATAQARAALDHQGPGCDLPPKDKQADARRSAPEVSPRQRDEERGAAAHTEGVGARGEALRRT